MKTFIQTSFDTIIDTDLWVKTENNKPVMNNEGLFEHRESIRSLYFYYPNYDNKGNLLGNIKIELFPNDIEKMYNEILRIKEKQHFLKSIEDNLPY